MKIRSIYIYLVGSIAIFLLIIFLSTDRNRAEGETDNSIEQHLPKDDIHKGIQPNGNMPNKSNVSGTTMEKLLTLKQQVDSNPNDTAIVREYADFLSMAHKSNEAVNLYYSILEKDPMRIDLYLKLTFLHYNLGQISKAEEVTKKVLEVDPGNLEARYNSGVIAATKGNNEAAKKIWMELKDKYPGTKAADFAKQSLDKIKK